MSFRSLDAVSNFATVREVMSESVQKLHSTVQSLLKATEHSTTNGNSDKWLEYSGSLLAAAETTTAEIEQLKRDLHSLITTLRETKVPAREKVHSPCDKTYLSISSIFVFASKLNSIQFSRLVKMKRVRRVFPGWPIWKPNRSESLPKIRKWAQSPQE